MNDSKLSISRPRRSGRRDLRGLGATARAVFVPEARGDPLAPYPFLSIDGRPLNLWLTDRVLKPVLDRWSRPEADRLARIQAVASDVEWASGRARCAFATLLPSAEGGGEPAVLAAMGASANLQRTVAVLGEFMLEPSAPAEPVVFRLSRQWCGLVDYPASAPYFSSRIERPGHVGRLRANRSDPGHLRNALWCSSAEIEARCTEAIAVLREEIRSSGLFPPGALAARGGAPAAQENKSGVVLLMNSSM